MATVLGHSPLVSSCFSPPCEPSPGTVLHRGQIKPSEPLMAQNYIRIYSSQASKLYSPIQLHLPTSTLLLTGFHLPPHTLPTTFIHFCAFGLCQPSCSQYPCLSFLYQNPSHCLTFSSNYSSFVNYPLGTPKTRKPG